MIVSIVCYARVITSHGRGWGGGIAKRCYLSEPEPTDPIRMLTRQIQKFNGHRHIAIITIINIIIIIITSIISLALRSSNILASVRSIKHRTLELRTHHHHHPHHPHHHHHINVIIGITIIEHFTSVAAVKHRALHGISNAHISSICSCSRCCWCVASCIGWAVLSSFASSVLVLVLMSLLCSIACWCLQWSAVLLPLRCLRVCFMCGEDSDQAKAEEREFSDRFGLRCQLFFTRIARHREVLLLSGDVRTMPPVTFCLIAAQVYSFMKVHSAIVVLCITLLMGLCLCAYMS